VTPDGSFLTVSMIDLTVALAGLFVGFVVGLTGMGEDR
jgi:hypothetical protein